MGEVIDINPELQGKKQHENRKKISIRAIGGAAAITVAVVGMESLGAQDDNFTTRLLEQNGQYYKGATITIDKGMKFFDRPAMVDNEQGSSVAGTFDAAERVTNPIIVRGFDSNTYAIVPSPNLPGTNRLDTIEALGDKGVAVLVQPGALQFKGGSTNELPYLSDLEKIPRDANQIFVAELE